MVQRAILLTLRHGSNALDTFVLVVRKHCQVGLALFETCLSILIDNSTKHSKEASAPQYSTRAAPRTICPAYVFTFTLLAQKAAQDSIKQPNQEKEHTRWQQLLKQDQLLWSSVSENTCRTGRMQQ
jgi:hypothetical protein